MRLTPDQQALLRQVADLDGDYARLCIEHDNLAEKRALDAHKATLQEVKDEGAQAVQVKQTTTLTLRKLEQDIAALEADRRSTDALLYSGKITTEKQVEAIKDELAHIRKRKYAFEDELLVAMEQQETNDATLATLVERTNELEVQVADLVQRYEAASGDIQAQQQAKREELIAVLRQMPPEFAKIYKDMRKEFTSGPIARLENGMCQSCRMELPSIDVQDILHDIERGELAYCSQCNIMLI